MPIDSHIIAINGALTDHGTLSSDSQVCPYLSFFVCFILWQYTTWSSILICIFIIDSTNWKQFPHKKRTPEFIGDIHAIIDYNISNSIKSIDREVKVSEFLIGEGVHEDIYYLSYKIRKGHFYDKAWRKKIKTALQSFSTNSSVLSNRIYFFSNERNLCQDQNMNSQNKRWFPLFLQNVPIKMKTNYLGYIFLSEVVTSNNDVMSPFIVPRGLSLNMEPYIKCFEEVALS